MPLSTSEVYRGPLGGLSAQGGISSSFLLTDTFTGTSCSVHQSWGEENTEGGARQPVCSGKLPITLAVNLRIFLLPQ